MLVSAIQKPTHLCVYTYTLRLGPSSHCPPAHPLGHHRALSWAPQAISRLPLAIDFMHNSMHMSAPLSQLIPSSPSPPPRPHGHSLHLHLYSCPANRYHFSRFHICVNTRYLLFWLTSLWMTGSRSILVSKNDPISFLFMAEQYSLVYTHHIVFIHLSMDI